LSTNIWSVTGCPRPAGMVATGARFIKDGWDGLRPRGYVAVRCVDKSGLYLVPGVKDGMSHSSFSLGPGWLASVAGSRLERHGLVLRVGAQPAASGVIAHLMLCNLAGGPRYYYLHYMSLAGMRSECRT